MTDKTSVRLAKLEAWRKSGQKLVMMENDYIENHPTAGSFFETTCSVVAVDLSKFNVQFDVTAMDFRILEYARRIGKTIYNNGIFPISVIDSLIPVEEYKSEIKSDDCSKFVIGGLVYLKPNYSKSSPSPQFPTVGSKYERHGKVIDIMQSMFGTTSKIQVRWFTLIDNAPVKATYFEGADLMTSEEFERRNTTRKEEYIIEGDPLISDNIPFSHDKGYFKSKDDSIFIHEKLATTLFTPKRN
jgi:hypothetical protein